MSEPLPLFAERRQESWADLGALIEQAGGRITKLDPQEVRRLGRRYREASADLAVARRRFPSEPLTRQLDDLVSRARPLVYGSVVRRQSAVEFATTGYWRRVRERPAFLVISAVALVLPMAIVGLWAHGNPADAASVAQVSPLTAGLGEDAPRDPDTQKVTDIGANAALSSQIFTNNIRVALAAFAGGLTGGVLTVVSLAFNGLILGLVAGLAARTGYGTTVLRLVIPHGLLELSLIIAAGAAGLRVGWAILHPGHRSRGEALAVEGRAGVEIAIGTAVLLVPCGLVEGFVTVRGLSLPVALAVGIGLAAAFWAMVLWRGAPVRSAPQP